MRSGRGVKFQGLCQQCRLGYAEKVQRSATRDARAGSRGSRSSLYILSNSGASLPIFSEAFLQTCPSIEYRVNRSSCRGIEILLTTRDYPIMENHILVRPLEPETRGASDPSPNPDSARNVSNSQPTKNKRSKRDRYNAQAWFVNNFCCTKGALN
jgi:hypothetical protein